MGIKLPEDLDFINPAGNYAVGVVDYEDSECTGDASFGFTFATGQEILDWMDAGGSCVDGNCLGGCGAYTSQLAGEIVEV